jgi:uncharacterized membrane protein
MNLRPMLFGNSLLAASMGAATAWAWTKIPDGVVLPVHFGIDGKADGFAPKAEALLIMPGMAIALTILFLVLPYVDPRRSNIEASGQFWNAAAISAVALLAYVHGLLIATAMGQAIDMTSALIPALAVLFMVLGNYMSKTRSNWFGGIRTPWTLSSEYSWGRTHRAAGALYIASGVLSLAAWATVGAQVSLIVLIGAITASSLLAVVLSWVYWRQDPARLQDA